MPQEKQETSFLPRYRVLDLTDEKGVYCGKFLGDLGADVIKIEPPGGDKLRSRGPFHKSDVHLEKSLPFLYFNTSKGSITLSIEDKTGQAIFKRLVEKADVVIESFPLWVLPAKTGVRIAYDGLLRNITLIIFVTCNYQTCANSKQN